MNEYDYSHFQRIIGKLEGVGTALPDFAQDYFLEVLRELDNLIEKMQPESAQR